MDLKGMQVLSVEMLSLTVLSHRIVRQTNDYICMYI